MEQVDKKEFLWYALYGFAGFGLEILLGMVENMLEIPEGVTSNCIHLILTSILWGGMAILLVRLSKKKLNFDMMANNAMPSKAGWITVTLIFITALVAKYFVIDGFMIVTNFAQNPFIQAILQIIYYLFEVGLIVITIAFAQRFVDLIIGKGQIPYGGLFLGCTWGLVHFLTQDFATGIYAIVSAVIYGVIYNTFKQNVKWAYLLILILFVI